MKQLPNIVEVRNLVAGYGRRDVIDVPQLSFARGTVTALIGPNAAGKSTLARTISGGLRPKSGKVILGGFDVHRMRAADCARRLAFLSQQNTDQFAFTVRELVQLGAGANPTAARLPADRIAEAIDRLELGPLIERDLLALSGGERQRAGIARALAQDTEVLILDEPTAHLDLRHQAALMDAVRAAADERGAAVILVLHDLNLAGAFANRLILLAEGKLVADGAPADVLQPHLIESTYQTKVQLVGNPSVPNPYIHLDPNSRNAAQPLV